MPVRRRFRRWVRDGGLAALGLVAIVLTSLYIASPDHETRFALRITAGSREGTRELLAEELVDHARDRGVDLRIVETAGSEAALAMVDQGACDLALVQGGLRLDGGERLRQVAALHVEPLHLLVGPGLAAEVDESLLGLAGRRVNLGELGSGTRALARSVLTFAGLPPGAYQVETRSYADLLAEASPASLPDAVFTVSTLPSRIARELVARHGYRLVALPFAEAFALSTLDARASANPGDPASRIVREHTYDAVIPAYTYEVEPGGVPPEPLHTLGTRLLLVAREDVSPAAVERLLDVVFSSRFAQVVYPPLEPQLLDIPPELTRHEGALAFMQRNRPLITGDFVDMAEKWFSIAGVTTGGLLFLWQWLRRRARARQDRGFESYILKVADVENRAGEQELSAQLDLATLLDLRRELARLKKEALERFAAGELEGEELMSGFLTHVSDTRSYLTRLILHERDNLEDAARLQGRPAEALWDEASSHHPTRPPGDGPPPVPAP